MVKRHTTLNVEDKLLKDAKEALINVSALTEEAIREKLGKKQVEITHSLKCEFCGRDGILETAREARRHEWKFDRLTWIYPDEMWICNKCLRDKIRQIPVST